MLISATQADPAIAPTDLSSGGSTINQVQSPEGNDKKPVVSTHIRANASQLLILNDLYINNKCPNNAQINVISADTGLYVFYCLFVSSYEAYN